mmetsp:Transcript_6809/g.11200  ORF Transcript_6809/g.11200 Transcript_6809/m.11200 type:complete len:213 (-) Transcript_6809:81-719(-)
MSHRSCCYFFKKNNFPPPSCFFALDTAGITSFSNRLITSASAETAATILLHRSCMANPFGYFFNSLVTSSISSSFNFFSSTAFNFLRFALLPFAASSFLFRALPALLSFCSLSFPLDPASSAFFFSSFLFFLLMVTPPISSSSSSSRPSFAPSSSESSSEILHISLLPPPSSTSESFSNSSLIFFSGNGYSLFVRSSSRLCSSFLKLSSLSD